MKLIIAIIMMTGICNAGLFDQLNVNMVKTDAGWAISNALPAGGGLINTNNEIWITTYGDSSGDGSPGDPLDWSQASFDLGKGKTINIAAGTYYADDVIEWDELAADTTIQGVGGVKIISTNNIKRIFYLYDINSALIIKNIEFTSTNTVASAHGAAIFLISDINSVIKDCVFTKCVASNISGINGGAISVSNTTIMSCSFNSCKTDAGIGGAIYADESIMLNCQFNDNSALSYNSCVLQNSSYVAFSVTNLGVVAYSNTSF